ncbi:hypothetical protein C8R45DRAFT_1209632 [Mycena sanguinolenta]|nr:hypothetical protein C8R45DRAFT_1209632 [Mycena sanguinolenta]
MSSACISSATATSTTVLTIDVLTTTFSTSVSTIDPPTTTIITSEECLLGSISDLPCLSTPTVFTSTIPGNFTTVSVPITDTVASTQTQVVTLFGSSCPVSTSVASSSSTVSSSSQTSRSSSLSASISTPPPITYESSVPITLGDGRVSVIKETFTSQPPATTVYNPFSTSGLVAQTNDVHSSQIGPIVGGVLGGFFGLIGLVLILWFIMKRRRRWDDIFDKDESSYSSGRRPTKRWSLDADMEPKPYQYGLVGQTSSPSLGMSSALESLPHTSGASPSSQMPRTTHNLPPLLTPTSVSTPGLSATTLSSRPSTAGSMLPLADSPVAPVSSVTHKQTGSSTSVQPHISPAMPSQWGHHSPSPSADQAYLDQPERSGSPTSMREWEPQRRLQLANLGDDESVSSPITPSASALNGGKAQHGRMGSGLSAILVDTAP